MDVFEKTITHSNALKANLGRTAVKVEVPKKYQILLDIAEDHYGLFRLTEEFLKELHHPFINWEYVIKTIKTISIGDFYTFSCHEKGIEAISAIFQIYFDILRRCPSHNLKQAVSRYLFEFITMLLTKSGKEKERNISILNYVINELYRLVRKDRWTFRKSSASLKAFLRTLAEERIVVAIPAFKKMVDEVYRATYEYWLVQPDPFFWNVGLEESPEYVEIIKQLSHERIRQLKERLDDFRCNDSLDFFDTLQAYISMPDHSQIVDAYFKAADAIERIEALRKKKYFVKLRFLYHMMNVEALQDVYTPVLIEINRCLGNVFKELKPEEMEDFVRTFFAMFKKIPAIKERARSVIDCISTMAKEVFSQENHRLVDILIEELISYGFQHPEIKGSTTEWQVVVNPAHVMNIRSWINIISIKPRWTKKLLSALIINLKLGGVFIKDTDLIQKDISTLLNSDITPAYNLIKQLVRVFPVFFTEIGAEGELREISTKVDEIAFRQDKLINFLRKQSHVESNSLLVNFIEDIFRFWHTGDRNYVKKYLPEEIFEQISSNGEYFDGMHRIFSHIMDEIDGKFENLLLWEKDKIQKVLRKINSVTEKDRERAFLMIRMYQLIYKKYNAQHIELLNDLELSLVFPAKRVKTLRHYLERKDYYRSLVIVMEFLSLLKERILSPKKTQGLENIYYKRHIAAGIPSMYGTYREEKFEALGLTLRLESLGNVLFEKLANTLNLTFITKSTLTKISKYLWLYVKALELDGISTEGITEKIKYITSALKVRQFSIDQYVDIFRFISRSIQEIIHDYYIDVHSSNLSIIVRQILEKENGSGNLSFTESDVKEKIYRKSENFLRSMVALSFGLQPLDNLINTIKRNLEAELERFSNNKEILNIVMRYIPELTISQIHKRDKSTDNPILIGNKGYFLKLLASLGFPVPPGFIITTEVFRGYDAVIGYKYIFKDLSSRIYDEILRLERITGQKYGDPSNPLLLSVRSGATISLPGMMSSFLNVGINEKIAEGLSRKERFRWAAWDSYRRFLQAWGMFQGLNRDMFDMIIDGFKVKYGVNKKIEFDPEQMREIAIAYRNLLVANGIELPDDPYKQLEKAILQVFASWYSERAMIYRKQLNVSDDWGTAVIVQKMVFGNLNEKSGSGVIFTRDPKEQSANVNLYGDFIFGVQGDDIVSGLVETYPVSENQKLRERRDSAITLESAFPEIYQELLNIAEKLVYEKGFHHQEIEFTFENPTKNGLYILQTRDMPQTEKKVTRRFRQTPDLQKSFLGTGIGVAGDALSGRVVYSEKDIEEYRKKEPKTPLILIRPDTVPDDVGILLKVDGLLTSRGGSTSHAAVTVPQLNKVGVVGFTKLKVYEDKAISIIEGITIRSGDFMSIDGFSGSVYLGKHEVEESRI